MRVVIRTLQSGTSTASGASGAEQSVQVDRLCIGRGTDQQVQLNDLRVALAHAEIVPALGSSYELVALGNESVLVNGAPRRGGALWPGDVLELGRYQLTVGKPEDDTYLLLHVEEKISVRAERAARRSQYPVSLLQTQLSRRRWAWLLAGGVLLICFVLPFALRYVWPVDLPPDRIWLSGPVSDAHARFGGDCAQCHAAPFERVRNQACTSCHQNLPEHSADPQWLAAGLGTDQQRCASCHREHHGGQGLVSQHPAACTQCHAQPDQHYAKAGLPAVRDFSSSHPPFTPRLAQYSQASGFALKQGVQEEGAVLHEDSNLIFPHDLHLAARGVEAPGGRRVLDCADCHQADSVGLSFAPVRMQAHCSDCHRLDFDPAQPGRELPHGQPAEVVRIIRDYYAARVLLGDTPVFRADAGGLRRRPGEAALPAPASAASARLTAEQAIQDVFDRRVCRYCHLVEKTTDPALPWTIAPVFLAEHALSGARFSHAAHRGETCVSCHQAKTSKDSRDVLLPDIRSCRVCHGERSHAGVVPSTCVSCHGFHIAPPPLVAARNLAVP